MRGGRAIAQNRWLSAWQRREITEANRLCSVISTCQKTHLTGNTSSQPRLITLTHFRIEGMLGSRHLYFEMCLTTYFPYNNIFWPGGAMILPSIFKLLGLKLISFQRCLCLLKREHHTSLSDAIIQNVGYLSW